MSERDAKAGDAVPVIEMTDVGVGALEDQTRLVLGGVNWRVEAGQVWVIGGLHGSGKSDLLALAAGLMPPQSGTYRLFGHEMPAFAIEKLEERLRLGLVFDGGHLFSHLNVAENIALPLRYHVVMEQTRLEDKVAAVLELTGLAEWAASPPSSLGRNWQKRVGLARALVLEPEVLLLDNPLGGMDPRHANWWLKTLAALSEHGVDGKRPMTLVITAEDMRPWKERGTHFAMLQRQRMEIVGHRAKLESCNEPLMKELMAEG